METHLPQSALTEIARADGGVLSGEPAAASTPGASALLPARARAALSSPQPRFNSFLGLDPGGFHRVAYTEWGDPANPHVVVCVHGFTRNCRDFDVLAARLADRYRVVCMDVVGRGASDWLKHRDDYDYSLYLSDAATLIARITETAEAVAGPGRRVDWIGTSMGGLIGMMLAAKPNTPIRRLLLNDVGPLIPWPALQRLWKGYLREPARFETLDHVEAYLRKSYTSFGPIPDRYWAHVARHSVRRLEDGDYALAYDPGIVSTMNHARRGVEFGSRCLAGVDLWPIWDRVQCPTLVLRGAASDVLLPDAVNEMQRRGPHAQIVEFAGIGHAPWLMAEDQIAVVRDFLAPPPLPL